MDVAGVLGCNRLRIPAYRLELRGTVRALSTLKSWQKRQNLNTLDVDDDDVCEDVCIGVNTRPT